LKTGVVGKLPISGILIGTIFLFIGNFGIVGWYNPDGGPVEGIDDRTGSSRGIQYIENRAEANLTSFVGVKGGADFIRVGSVGADRFVELVAGGTELFGPVGDVGGHLRIDLFGVVRSFSMLLVDGVGFMDFGCFAVFGHTSFLLSVLLG
jgi:hypothetical protein